MVELWLFFHFCFWGPPKNFWDPQKRSKFWILDPKLCLKKLSIGPGLYGKSVLFLGMYYVLDYYVPLLWSGKKSDFTGFGCSSLISASQPSSKLSFRLMIFTFLQDLNSKSKFHFEILAKSSYFSNDGCGQYVGIASSNKGQLILECILGVIDFPIN